MAFYQLIKKQHLTTTLDVIWEFISTPQKLKEITPAYMGFDIVTKNLPNKIYKGMIIHYHVKPLLGIKMSWVTEITQMEELRYFVDEQRIGPYSIWHHQHLLEPTETGVLMTDIVSYKPPFGFLGVLANSLFIRKQLEFIFNYRQEVLNRKFPEVNVTIQP